MSYMVLIAAGETLRKSIRDCICKLLRRNGLLHTRDEGTYLPVTVSMPIIRYRSDVFQLVGVHHRVCGENSRTVGFYRDHGEGLAIHAHQQSRLAVDVDQLMRQIGKVTPPHAGEEPGYVRGSFDGLTRGLYFASAIGRVGRIVGK